MILARKKFTLGDSRQYSVDYSETLREGYWLTSVAVTSSDPVHFPVTNVLIVEGKVVTFFVSNGILNGNFTVTLVATESNTEVSNHTIEFSVIAP
jgi:hypothetical protein